MNRKMPAAAALLLIGMLSGGAAAAPAQKLEAATRLAANHCAVCHTFDKGGPPGQGPNLFGIMGSKAGAAEGYAYSESFKKSLAGQNWDPKLMDQWLRDTQALAPGTGMTYFQDDPKKRSELIKYLETLR